MTRKSAPWPDNGVALMDFSAPWCGPCKSQKPIVSDLKRSYGKQVAISVINIDEHRELAARLGIQSIPTLIVFKDGKEIKRFVGLQSRAVLRKAIDKALA